MMRVNQDNAEKWVDSTTDLIESYRQLISMRLVQHSSLGISIGVISILCMLMAVFVLLFVGLGAAWWLGESLHNMKLGFFMVSGIYLLLFIGVLIASRKLIIPRIRDAIIKKIYEQD